MAIKKLSVQKRNEISDKLINEKLFQKGLQLPQDDFEEQIKERSKKLGISPEDLKSYFFEKTDLFTQKMKEHLK